LILKVANLVFMPPLTLTNKYNLLVVTKYKNN